MNDLLHLQNMWCANSSLFLSPFLIHSPLFEDTIQTLIQKVRWKTSHNLSNTFFNFSFTFIAKSFFGILCRQSEDGQNSERHVSLLRPMSRSEIERREERSRDIRGYCWGGLRERCCPFASNEAKQDLQDVVDLCHVSLQESLSFVDGANGRIRRPSLKNCPDCWRLPTILEHEYRTVVYIPDQDPRREFSSPTHQRHRQQPKTFVQTCF